MKELEFSPDSTKKFNMLPMNRPISPKHVTQMAKSVQKRGLLRPIICVSTSIVDGTRKTWIVDGQHLFHAILRLGISFKVIMVDIEDINDLVDLIATLNTTSKSWQMHDYVHCWAGLKGKADYARLLKYKEEYKYSYTTLLMACNPNNMSHASRNMKEGRFTIQNRDLTETILTNLRDVFNIFPKGYKSEVSTFVQAYIGFYMNCKNYVHHKMLDAIRVNRSRLTTTLDNTVKCREELSMIYHAGTAKENTRVAVEMRTGSLKGSK